MTFLEALKTGKRMKRSSSEYYFLYDDDISLNKRDILADDWEVEEEKKTGLVITAEEIDAAIHSDQVWNVLRYMIT